MNDSRFVRYLGYESLAEGGRSLGFTYGVYTLSIKDSVYKGTYVSIWKKQNDGSWKFVLDSGNEGIHN